MVYCFNLISLFGNNSLCMMKSIRYLTLAFNPGYVFILRN